METPVKSPPTIIAPTIGRKVWYWPSLNDSKTLVMRMIDERQAFDATIVCVHDDRCVNLSVIDHIGNQSMRLNVKLLQEGDEEPTIDAYCQWMPYQTGQAKKQADPEPINDKTQAQLEPIYVDGMGVFFPITYTILPDGRTTVCQITLENGFTINGLSANAPGTEFDEMMGRSCARADAENHLFEALAMLNAQTIHKHKLMLDDELPF